MATTQISTYVSSSKSYLYKYADLNDLQNALANLQVTLDIECFDFMRYMNPVPSKHKTRAYLTARSRFYKYIKSPDAKREILLSLTLIAETILTELWGSVTNPIQPDLYFASTAEAIDSEEVELIKRMYVNHKEDLPSQTDLNIMLAMVMAKREFSIEPDDYKKTNKVSLGEDSVTLDQLL